MKKLNAICLLALIGCVSIFAQIGNPNLQTLVIVKYKGETEAITLGSLKQTAKPFEAYGGPLTVERKKDLLDSMIADKLLSIAAEKEGYTATDNQANQYFQQQLSQIVRQPITEAQFAEQLQKSQGITLDQYIKQQNGMSLAEYKKLLKRQIAQNQYIGAKKQDELQKNSVVTHEEILSYYNNNRATFVQPETIEIFHVIIQKGDDEAATKKYADELLASLKSGKITQDSMIQNTEANIKAGKTDIKYIAQNLSVYRIQEYMMQLGMNQETFDALYDEANLKKYSKVEEVADSYRFYYPISRTDTKLLGINDVVQKGTTVTVYKYIENMLTMQKQQQAIIEARKDLANSLTNENTVQWIKSGAELDELLKNW